MLWRSAEARDAKMETVLVGLDRQWRANRPLCDFGYLKQHAESQGHNHLNLPRALCSTVEPLKYSCTRRRLVNVIKFA